MIAEVLDGLGDEPARWAEGKAIGVAHDLTVTQLRARIKRMVKAADPAAAEEKKKAARRERRVEIWENSSGTADLVGRDLAAEEVEAIWNRLSAVAQAMRADGDQRPIDAIRADLFLDLLRGVPLPEAARQPYDSESPCRAGRSDESGVAEEGPADDVAIRPAGRDDVRPTDDDVLAEIERRIAEALASVVDERLKDLLARTRGDGPPGDGPRGDGRLDGRMLLVSHAVEAMDKALENLRDQWCDATGRHAHDGYRPPASMRRLVGRRHRTCVFPTCNRRSAACDIDHTRPYDPTSPDGGRTRPDNLAPFCRRHHRKNSTGAGG